MCKSDRLKGIQNIGYSRSDKAMFAMKKFIGFFKFGVLQTRITIREFATSETMMIRQKATVPPIFRAVKLRQLQYSLDPFPVELMLRFATYLWNCTYAVKKL